MSHVTHRLKGSFEGALAGGGDPATSPLYVFGPFLRLLGASGVGVVSFGAPIWMVVATVVVVSVMYRRVMRWVPDGSGGSGLCEEEFGGWAVKISASITIIEYTLTFLVSLAALVTFLADRAGGLGHGARVLLAVTLTLGVGVVVNRGPAISAKVFGPATAAVLALLWALVGSVIYQRGFHVPSFSLQAFSHANVSVTLGGYVRLLALMTGIEVFANLVAAYEGSPEKRARQAFISLVLVMVTTLVTMMIVGPAIFELADPTREDVSVFTQAMDQLLPAPLAYTGTLIGVVVLLSAAAASAQGLQNLALGLRHRHYIPTSFGERNRFDVADRPVSMQVLLIAACFLAFGTHEETYLALYAAGVFVLLGLTGWASVKRLWREPIKSAPAILSLIGTMLAALVTSGAAALIFFERFTEGAWAYFVLVPALYVVFTKYRHQRGAPWSVKKHLEHALKDKNHAISIAKTTWPRRILAVVDGRQVSETALVAGAHAADLFAVPWNACVIETKSSTASSAYAALLDRAFVSALGVTVQRSVLSAREGTVEGSSDLLVVARECLHASSIIQHESLPILVVRASGSPGVRYPWWKRVLVALDGSPNAETVLPYAVKLLTLGAKLQLIAVPDGDTTPTLLRDYVNRIAETLRVHGDVDVFVGGSGPARTVMEQATQQSADLVVIGSHGQGGQTQTRQGSLGSVSKHLLAKLDATLLIIPSRFQTSVLSEAEIARRIVELHGVSMGTPGCRSDAPRTVQPPVARANRRRWP